MERDRYMRDIKLITTVRDSGFAVEQGADPSCPRLSKGRAEAGATARDVQVRSLGLAKMGVKYDAIIKHYYPGLDVTKAY